VTSIEPSSSPARHTAQPARTPGERRDPRFYAYPLRQPRLRHP
jgi:hypothetical protein